MLRITENMSYLTGQQDLARAQYQLALKQRQASSGVRVERPSDDPAAAARVVSLDSERQAMTRCRDNTSSAVAELQAADQGLGAMGDVLLRLRELATAMASDQYSASDRATAAEEVRGLRDQMISLANTRVGEVYIFGGYQSGTPAVDGTGNVVADSNIRHVLAAPGLEVEASVSAVEALDPAGGQDVLALLDTLASDLQADNVNGIRSAVGTLGQCQQQVTSVWARAGIQLDSLNRIDQINGDQLTRLDGQRSTLVEADAVQTLSDLVRAQQTLSGALQVTAQMLSGLSLVDKL